MHNHRLVANSWIGLFSGLLMSCSIGADSASSHPAAQEKKPDHSVIVSVSIVGGPMLPGAQVLLVTSTGTELLGITDSLGVAKVPRTQLAASDAYALLICAEHFFCGAFRLDTPGFPDLNDYFIALAPFAI